MAIGELCGVALVGGIVSGNDEPLGFGSQVDQGSNAGLGQDLLPIAHVVELPAALDRASTTGTIELMAELASPLPATIIMEMLGIPLAGQPLVRAAAATIAEFLSLVDPAEGQLAAIAARLADFAAYLAPPLHPHDVRDAVVAAWHAERVPGTKPVVVDTAGKPLVLEHVWSAAAAASGGLSGGARNAVLPHDRTNAVAIADIPGLVVWAWPMGTAAGQIGKDLVVLRGMLGADARVALVRYPEARVISGPLAGEVGPRLEAPAFGSAIFAACALPGGALLVAPDIAWDQEAETHTSAAGFTTQRGA